MKKNYKVTGSDRKALVQVIGQTIGVKPVYMKVPTCAYAIGDITVDKEGSMIWDERTDETTIQKISKALAAAGFTDEHSQQEVEEQQAPEAIESEAAAEPEPVELTVSLPTTRHTGNTLRNLVNLVYTRAGLINKALGTRFAAEKELTEVLAEAEWIYTAEDFRLALASYEEEHGPALTGITITPETITFSTLPETNKPETIKAFTELVAMMNKQALEQKRIHAKVVNEENEKYALRIWLTRLGMNGPEYKGTRKVLMENLSGHAAFRTEADKQRWMERQTEKRAAAKTAEEVTEE